MSKKLNFKGIRTIRLPLILFILALLISLIFSQNKIMTMNELYKYLTGISLLLVSASLTKDYQERIIFCIIMAGFLISGLAIYQFFFGFQRVLGYISKQGIQDPFIWDYLSRKRAYFPFVTPNLLGGYLAMLIPLTFIPLEKTIDFQADGCLIPPSPQPVNHVRDKSLDRVRERSSLTGFIYHNRIWFIIPLSFALLFTGSLGALLSLFLGVVIYLYLQRRLDKRKIIFLFALLIIISLVFVSRTAGTKEYLQPFFSTLMRLNYWQDTLKIIKNHPLTGIGLGNFNLRQSRYAHNTYLQLWAEMGILGVISILWLMLAVVKYALQNIKGSPCKKQILGLIAAVIIFSIHNFIDFSFFLPEVSFIWWAILGITVSTALKGRANI